MPTRLTLSISSPEDAGKSWQIEIAEDFEEVFNKLFPIHPPASNLEARQNMRYTRLEGGSMSIQPGHVVLAEEILE